AKAVAQICRRLDGIPLAIELAAARVSALSPQQISQRLDDQFRLLTGGSRTSLERQQTLRAAVDWSYKLLSDQERVLLRRLSIFHGGFTMEAAEKIASGDGLGEPDVVDLLSQLVSKSLVQRETGEGDGRYRLLETIRQFSREKMLEADDVQETGKRHRDFFLEFAEQAGPELDGPNVGLWMENLEAEVDNLRAAMTWSDAEGDQKPLLRFGAALNEFWITRGYMGEGLQLMERALSREAEPSVERVRALSAASRLALIELSVDKSRAFAIELMEQSETLDDNWGRARAHLIRGFLNILEGEMAESEQHLLEAERLTSGGGDADGFTLAAVFRSELASFRGDSIEEGALLEIALQRARAAGQKLMVGRILGGMSGKAIRRGDWQKFREIAEEGLATSAESGDKMLAAIYSASLSKGVGSDDPQWAAAVAAARDFGDPEWFQTLGSIAFSRDALEETKALWGEALDICRAQNRGGLPRMLNQAGWAIFLTGDLSEARKYLEECVPLARTSTVRLLLFYALHSYGEILRAAGELERAREILEESLAGARDLGQRDGIVHAQLSLGDIDRAEGKLDEAAARYFEGGLIRIAADALNELPHVLERMAGVALDKGLVELGLKMLGASRKIREVHRSSIDPVYREARLHDLQGLTEAAGEAAESLLAEGEMLDPREALDLARGLVPPARLDQILEDVKKPSDEALTAHPNADA
ncbi:MAG TPA: hypothetical protein VND22_10020, partial [Actinomycetota bacterium]|nr:hypothetical protein [Actinomycetota bacterium]